MANYTGIITGIVASVKQRITTKNTTDSIDPIDVGGSITDLAEALLPILNTINEFDILGGSVSPANTIGKDGDIYIQDGTSLIFWKKVGNAWVNKRTVNLGINIPDGNISLQSRIQGQTVTISSGSWGIGNVIFNKATQTQFTVPAANENFDRIDAVLADNVGDGNLSYVSGTASVNPDNTKPVTPANNIVVNYVYIPSLSSGNLPYLADGNDNNTNEIQLATSGNVDPDNGSGSNGDFYFKVTANELSLFQKGSAAWANVFTFNIPEPTQTTLRRTFIIPAGTSAPSGVISLVGLTNEQGDQIIPDKALWAIYDGGRSGGQQYARTNSEVQGLETDENELTVNEVLVVLDGVETTTIALKNDSGVDMLYSINNGQTGSFSANQIIQITPGDSLILSTITQPLDPISLRDQNGYLQNTDGGFYIEQTPHQWIIPNNSTLLFIESGLG